MSIFKRKEYNNLITIGTRCMNEAQKSEQMHLYADAKHYYCKAWQYFSGATSLAKTAHDYSRALKAKQLEINASNAILAVETRAQEYFEEQLQSLINN